MMNFNRFLYGLIGLLLISVAFLAAAGAFALLRLGFGGLLGL